MSDYEFRPGGSLKLKGTDESGKKKKKKSKNLDRAAGEAQKAQERQRVKDLLLKDGDNISSSKEGSTRNSPVPGSSSSRKTDAEKRFEQAQRERMAARVAKLATKTHKDRVNDFNAKLEALSEHHDIPKGGPG